MQKKVGTVFIMIAVIFIILIIGSFILYYKYSYKSVKTLYFKEGTEDFNNPDRGFYTQLNTNEPGRLLELEPEGINLVLAAYDMKDYLNIPLDNEKLSELETFLKEASKLNIKVIFRAAYDFYGKYTDPESMDTILGHIEQICEILNQYKGNILCVQAGFLGPWGEWHGSEFLKEDMRGINNRNKVLKKLLDNLDEDMIINVRRPQFIRDAKNAGLNIDRFGIHNDALLSTVDDMGTYSNPDYDRETELKWMEKWILTGINGGEMPTVSEYNNSSNAIKEMLKMKICYLNSKYNVEVLDKWKEEEYKGENSLAYIKSHLGYRLSIKKVAVSELLRNGYKFMLEGTLQNTGFAPISDNYKLGIVLKKGEQMIEQPLDTFSLSSLKNNQSDNFRFEMVLPKDFVMEEEVEIGVRIMKSINFDLEKEALYSYVRLTNNEVDFEDNVNYFVKYKKVYKKEQKWKGNSNSLKDNLIGLFKNIGADSIYYQLSR